MTRSPFAALFALDPAIDYLNHGSFGACPRAVLDHRARLYEILEREPVRFLAREIDGRIDRALGDLAEFVGCPPADLAFVDNATTGVNTILRSARLEPGDEILTTDHAYPACRNAMEHAAGVAGARVVVASVPFPTAGPETVVEAVLGAVTARTRLAVLDHVTSGTALVFPLERLVAELEGRGIATIVDGAHAVGMLPLALAKLGASYYTSNAHKWLCAPKGAAILYVRPDRQEGLHPLVISHGYAGPGGGASSFRREFDWVGTRDPSSWLSAPEALRFLDGLLPGGWPEVARRNRALALEGRRALVNALDIDEPCPESMLGSMASLPLPACAPGAPVEGRSAQALRDLLHDAHAIEVQFSDGPGSSGKLVRISAQVYNSEEQYVRLASVLREVLGRERARA
jgi:isopenicillin-N epimerase